MAEVERQQVDAHRFTMQVERALAVSDVELRAGLLRQALDIWRGPLLADVASPRLRDRVGATLEQLRMTAIEAMIDAELGNGRHRQLIGQLTSLTAEHPYQERFHAQLMLALYRAGRQCGVLEAYQRLRARMAEDLGIGPALSVQQLHTAILRHDPRLATPISAPATVGHDWERKRHYVS